MNFTFFWSFISVLMTMCVPVFKSSAGLDASRDVVSVIPPNASHVASIDTNLTVNLTGTIDEDSVNLSTFVTHSTRRVRQIQSAASFRLIRRHSRSIPIAIFSLET